MAQPILLQTPPRDPRAELEARLRDAPLEHAEALLAGLDLLQKLHDHGTLDLLRGAAGSRDQVIRIAVEAANTPETIRGLRNLFVLLNTFGSIPPETLAALVSAIPQGLEAGATPQPDPPGLWKLIREFAWDPDVRRGHHALISLLRAVGASMAEAKRS